MDTLIAIALMVIYTTAGFLQLLVLVAIPLAAVSLIIFLIDLQRKRG